MISRRVLSLKREKGPTGPPGVRPQSTLRLFDMVFIGPGAPSPFYLQVDLKVKSTDGATTEGAPNAMRGYPIQGVVPGSCTPSCLWLEPLLLSPPLPSLPLPFPPLRSPSPPSLVSSPWTARGYIYIYCIIYIYIRVILRNGGTSEE